MGSCFEKSRKKPHKIRPFIPQEIITIQVKSKDAPEISKTTNISKLTTGRQLKMFIINEFFKESDPLLNLLYSGQTIKDQDKIVEYGKETSFGMTIQFEICKPFALHNVFVFFKLKHQLFNQIDFDYSQNAASLQFRGGFPYYQPSKGKRFGLQVDKRYDGGDDSWIKMDKGWATAFHGIRYPAQLIDHHTMVLQSILNGLDHVFTAYTLIQKDVQAYQHTYAINKPSEMVGRGIYCSPNIQICLNGYCVPVEIDKMKYKIVLQCKVKSQKIKVCNNHTYWVINDPKDIRTYGIVLFSQQQYLNYPEPSQYFNWETYKDTINKHLATLI